jgi:hypothetical protein
VSRRRTVIATLLLLLLLAGAARGHAQAAPAVGNDLTVSLVTFGSATEVFERFGHDAIWFHDERVGLDVAYHWGLFDFNEPHFVMRFVTGDTRYAMGGESALGLIERERATGRTVTVQRLALAPAQAQALLDFVRWNALPENRYYRYDYFRDNCATRLRDALDHALGGALEAQFDTARTTLTYRSESIRLTDGDRPAQLGIDLALGQPADRYLTRWESFFIPMRIRDALREVRVAGPSGTPVPLVAEERVLGAVPGTPQVQELDHVPQLVWRYGLCGLVLAAFVVALRIMMVTRRGAAWGLSLVASVWWLVCGVLGILIALAWVATQHVFWARNQNLLLLTPLCLLLVVLTPAWLLRGRAKRLTRVSAGLVALLGLFAALLALIPGGQRNGAIVALLLPVHLALAWALLLPRRDRVPSGT